MHSPVQLKAEHECPVAPTLSRPLQKEVFPFQHVISFSKCIVASRLID